MIEELFHPKIYFPLFEEDSWATHELNTSIHNIFIFFHKKT